MKVSFSNLGMHSVVDADIDVAEINGVGGHAAPQLWVPLRINIHHGVMQPHDGFEFVSLSGRLSLAGEPFSRTVPATIGLKIIPKFNKTNEHRYLEFPLDPLRVATLERVRSGGDLKVHLDAELDVMQLRALNPDPTNLSVMELVWAQVQLYRLHLSTDLTIPRTAWIERVLPRVGFGTVHLVELPAIPLGATEAMSHAYEALRQAQEFHKSGHYTEAVGKCRIALEEFFEYSEETDAKGLTRPKPKLRASWETRLGKATYDWLNHTLSALKSGTNKPHHLASATYSQFDSQMIQMITTAVVAYAATHLAADSST